MRLCVLLRNFNIVKKEGVFLQIDKTLLNARYIYLDWNVIKYMKEPRLDKGGLDKEFKNTVIKLKKKYKLLRVCKSTLGIKSGKEISVI